MTAQTRGGVNLKIVDSENLRKYFPYKIFNTLQKEALGYFLS